MIASRSFWQYSVIEVILPLTSSTKELPKMSNATLLSTSVPLGQWVDTLLNTVFFQPDDDLAMDTYKQFYSPDISIR